MSNTTKIKKLSVEECIERLNDIADDLAAIDYWSNKTRVKSYATRLAFHRLTELLKDEQLILRRRKTFLQKKEKAPLI